MSTEFPAELILDVTQEHIEIGVRGDCSLCPIALAAREHFPELKVIIDDDTLAFYDERYFSLTAIYKTPRAAESFMSAFDEGLTVSPRRLTFERIEEHPKC